MKYGLLKNRIVDREGGIKIPHSPFLIPHSVSSRGVTLLELLIYVAILSGLMVVVSDAFISLSKGRGQSEARSEVNSAVRFASERIKQDIKNASLASIPLFGTPSNTLSLTTVSGSTILYDVSGGALRRKVDTSEPELVTGGAVSVDTPTFTRIENYNSTLNATTTAIQVAMTFRYSSNSTDWEYENAFRTTITLR